MRLSVSTFMVAMIAVAHGKRHLARPQPLPPEVRPLDSLVVAGSTIEFNHTRVIPAPPPTAPTSPPSPVPTPLDLSLSYSLSSSCLLYLTNLLPAANFTSCLPFSLLLTTSTSYSTLVTDSITSSNLTDLDSLLAYVSSPQPSPNECDAFMAAALSDIGEKSNCGADLAARPVNAVANEAQNGIGNYKLMREAAAMTDPETGVYCYLEAVSSSKPDDLYLWSLPAGIALPYTIKPTCSNCSALLLQHYSESLSSTSTLNGTLVSEAINVVKDACGGAFVNYNASYSGASALLRLPGSRLITAIVVALVTRTLLV